MKISYPLSSLLRQTMIMIITIMLAQAVHAWDAGPEDCINDTCDGGQVDVFTGVPDTQPKWASSSLPNSTGRVADCPEGYTNNGATCGRSSDDISAPSRVADCPSGYTNNGATCGRGSKDVSTSSRVADCPSGYTNNGATCGRGSDDISSPSRVADCPSGFTNMGASCLRVFPPASLGMGSMTCSSSEFRSGARCYDNCPSGYTNMGESCHRAVSTLGTGSMTCHNSEFKSGARCYTQCPSGYTNTGEYCHRPASTLGMGSMSCNLDEFRSGARCHDLCPSGYTNTGEFCHRPVSTYGMEKMSCNADEFLSGARCYPNEGTCDSGEEFYASLCYTACPAGSKRTAVSTCTHEIKWRGNTHLWVVNQAIELLKNNDSSIAQQAVEKLNNSECRASWEKGLWDADDPDGDLVDSPSTSAGGTHFYNAAGHDAWGDPIDYKTYMIAGTSKDSNGNARIEAKSNIDKIGHFEDTDDCYSLGLALHYATDMTQPMHTTGFSGASIPIMLHPTLEEYIPTIQTRFPGTATWDQAYSDMEPDLVFHEIALKSAGFSEGLMDVLENDDGTFCTMTPESGITYSGYCFLNDADVDNKMGEILKAGYQTVASYLYSVIKDKYQGYNIESLLGHYQRLPVTNNWHDGYIKKTETGVQWKNAAGWSWTLTPDLENDRLLTSQDCPYYNVEGGKSFIVQREGGVVKGFTFMGELYSL